MQIKNTTKKTEIVNHYIYCSSAISKALGLMFRKKPEVLVFDFKKEKIVMLHMLFVFFPIDVLFLDKNKTVVEVKENLRPFGFYRPKNKSKFIIELPKGKIKATKTEINDKIDFS